MLENRKINVLFVCSWNRQRSLTAEKIFKNDQRFNVRSAGTSSQANHIISLSDVEWADLILCMENEHREKINLMFKNIRLPEIKVLYIDDTFDFMNPELVEILKSDVDRIIGKLIK